MSRTMTKEEHAELSMIIEKKRKELDTPEKIIEYLNHAGFCDEKGNPIYPYN